MSEVFVSQSRPRGDLAGVFEHDGDVGYFYLYEILNNDKGSILSYVHVIDRMSEIDERGFTVKWSPDTERVFLIYRGQTWAAFDVSRKRSWGLSQGGVCDITV